MVVAAAAVVVVDVVAAAVCEERCQSDVGVGHFRQRAEARAQQAEAEARAAQLHAAEQVLCRACCAHVCWMVCDPRFGVQCSGLTAGESH